MVLITLRRNSTLPELPLFSLRPTLGAPHWLMVVAMTSTSLLPTLQSEALWDTHNSFLEDALIRIDGLKV